MNKLLTAETSNYQLQEIAKRIGLPINAIVYVEQMKHLSIPTTRIANYIINLHHPAHWVGVIVMKYNGKKIGFYFNSLLYPDISKEIIHFFKRCGCFEYYDSKKAVQLAREGFCGEYVIDWLFHMNKKNNPFDAYKAFLNKLRSTNNEIENYLNQHHLL